MRVRVVACVGFKENIWGCAALEGRREGRSHPRAGVVPDGFSGTDSGGWLSYSKPARMRAPRWREVLQGACAQTRTWEVRCDQPSSSTFVNPVHEKAAWQRLLRAGDARAFHISEARTRLFTARAPEYGFGPARRWSMRTLRAPSQLPIWKKKLVARFETGLVYPQSRLMVMQASGPARNDPVNT